MTQTPLGGGGPKKQWDFASANNQVQQPPPESNSYMRSSLPTSFATSIEAPNITFEKN